MKEIIDVLISKEELHRRITELGKEVNEEYKDKEVIMIAVLKGAVMFLTDFAKEFTGDVLMDFLAVSSYHGGTHSSGNVRVLKDLEYDLEGKHVLVVEDIVDTGRSLETVLRLINSRKPADVKVCTLLDKPSQRIIENLTVDYVGFTIENLFVVGYGLDYEEKYRNLDYVGVMRFED